MGRELRRVSYDFRWPLHEVWYGHYIDTIRTCIEDDGCKEHCDQCREAARIKGARIDDCGCPDWEEYLKEPMRLIKELLAPPAGDGYQLWETTTEGSPISPVFQTLDELCAWCEDNATVFADEKISKEEWRALLTQTVDERSQSGLEMKNVGAKENKENEKMYGTLGLLYHVNISVRRVLAAEDSFLEQFAGVLAVDKDRFFRPDKVRKFFEYRLAEGLEYIPLGPCNNFDPKQGCKGHPTIARRKRFACLREVNPIEK